MRPGRLVDRPRPPSGGQVPPGRLVDPYRPGKKGRAQGPRRRPRAFLPPPNRSWAEGRDTRADACDSGDRRAPPAPRPRALPPPPRERGRRGRPATPPDPRPHHASRPSPGPARGRGPAAGKRRRARRPEAGRRRQGRPSLLPREPPPPTPRGGRRSPSTARGDPAEAGAGAEDTPPPAHGEAGPAEGKERGGGGTGLHRHRRRRPGRPPGRSDKPLCRGLTFNRSQRGSCSATYETPTQKQVVYEWFSTRRPTNVRCVTGEGAAAFPAAPRVPGRRALRTGPRSRRAAGPFIFLCKLESRCFFCFWYKLKVIREIMLRGLERQRYQGVTLRALRRKGAKNFPRIQKGRRDGLR